jgi:molybdopterin-guanine dinucleotide biosynthesis protein MobB
VKRIHVVGRKDSGKTTLIVELVEHLTARGLRVGTIKHTHHQHELDTPGKDSHRHRTAGAAVVGILSPLLNAVYIPARGPHDAPDRYESLAPLFQDCDLVLVEGHSQADALKVEVWRSATGQPPLATGDRAILAVVTDEPLTGSVPVLPRGDVPGLAAQILAWLDTAGT